MSLRLKLDQGVPRDAASRLRANGYECIHVGEAGLSAASDDEILRFALEKHAVIVTLDADFHAMLAVSGARGPAVIPIRVQGVRGLETAQCIGVICSRLERELLAGSSPVGVRAGDRSLRFRSPLRLPCWALAWSGS